MRHVGWALAGVAAASLAMGGTTATSAFAMTPLVLKEGGVVAAEGSPATGSLDLTCALLEFAGTLTVNGEPTDEAVFDEGGGADVCEGVLVGGVVKAMKVTKAGRFVVLSHLIYESVTSKTCVWVISRLSGTFAVPGPTTTTVYGTGKLAVKRSAAGCAEQIPLEGRAALASGTTREPYFAET